MTTHFLLTTVQVSGIGLYLKSFEYTFWGYGEVCPKCALLTLLYLNKMNFIFCAGILGEVTKWWCYREGCRREFGQSRTGPNGANATGPGGARPGRVQNSAISRPWTGSKRSLRYSLKSRVHAICRFVNRVLESLELYDSGHRFIFTPNLSTCKRVQTYNCVQNRT